jgi:hypothetical protein
MVEMMLPVHHPLLPVSRSLLHSVWSSVVTALCVVKLSRAIRQGRVMLSYAMLSYAAGRLVQTLAPFNVGCWECWCHRSNPH